MAAASALPRIPLQPRRTADFSDSVDFAPDAEQYVLHGERLAQGHAQMRERFLARFAEPDLHARLLSRTVVGAMVVDCELITRNFPEGLGTVEMLCVYEVVNGRIQRASFATGAKCLGPPALPAG